MDRLDEYTNYVWKFFSLHAQQRISLFNVYIFLFSLFSSAISYFIAAHIKKLCQITGAEFFVILILCGSFFIISILFILLDKRCKTLISHAKDYFEAYEFELIKEDKTFENLMIFTKDKQQLLHNCCYFKYGHNFCFKLMFGFGAVLAACTIILAFVSYHFALCIWI